MKKIITGILTVTMVMLLMMPFVSAWSTSASAVLTYGRSRVDSANVAVSRSATYTGNNTTTSSQSFNSVDYGCYAGWMTSIFTREYSFYVEYGKPKKVHTETQSRDSKFYISAESSGQCKETGTGTVRIN